VKIPTGLGSDFGLTSVLYDNSSNHACITAFTRKTPPVLFSLQNCAHRLLDKGYHSHLGTEIQCGAHCPSGSKLVLVNNRNEIFTVRRHPDARWHVDKMKVNLKRKQIAKREDMMAIAIPNEDIIHLFWIEGGEWRLKTI